MLTYYEWKEEKILSDEKILNDLKQIPQKYGYEFKGKYIHNLAKINRRYDFVKVNFDNFIASVNTVSSNWTVEQAIIFQMELEDAIRLASELNVYMNKMEQKLKAEYLYYTSNNQS